MAGQKTCRCLTAGRRATPRKAGTAHKRLNCASDYYKMTDTQRRACREDEMVRLLARWKAEYPAAILGKLKAAVVKDGSNLDIKATVPASVLGRGPFEIRIASAPNPDLMYGQGTGTGYWQGSQPLRDRWESAPTIAAVAEIVRAHTAGIGFGNWTGGQIRRKGGRKVLAQVSYNGRVWLAGSWPTPEVV